MNEAKYREAEAELWRSAGLVPKEHFVPLAGTGTSVRIQEVGDGPDVLFIHGGPNSGSTWAHLVAHIDGFRCLLLDRPGTGLSEDYVARGNGVVDYASHLVPDVLDALEVEKAHVVASSFGGYCALRSAADAPERFGRMVQMACPALLPDQPLPPFMKAIMKPGVRKIIAALPPNAKAQESIMRQIGHGKSIDAGRLDFDGWYAALQRHTNTMRNEFDMIHSFKASGGFDPSIALTAEALARVETPTHFLWGEDDTFGGEDVAQWVVSAMPNATLKMIPDSGHLPWLDDPVHIASETAGFLLEAGTP